MIADKIRKKLCFASAISALVVAGVMIEPATLQAQSFDSSSAAAAAEIRFQQLEKEIRRLTGRVEEQSYEIRNLRADLKKIAGDIEYRVNDLERGGLDTPSVSGGNNAMPVNVGGNPTAIVEEPPFQYNSQSSASKNGSQTLGTINKSQNNGSVSSNDAAPKAYEYAYAFIKARDFSRAEKEFAKFMENHPDHKLVSNAKYWYGETFYVRGDYEKAARIFAEGYQKFPKGSKAASNLLKLGMALSGMGKTNDACVAYKQLKKDYAKSSAPVLKRTDTEMKRINCK